ncbi:hypothetical protein ACOMHN_004837 [Nucella lapillus]
MSTSFYMAVSAVVDTFSLLMPLPPHYLYVNFPHIFDSIRNAHVLCSICHPSGWITSNLGVFLTVAMTVDRSLAIQFPLRAPTLCTVRRAKVASLCLVLLVLLMDGHVAFTTRMVSKEVLAYLCAVDTSFSDSYRVFHDVYWPYLHNVSLMLSFIVIIIGNVIIVLHVKRSEDSKELGQGTKSSGGSQPGKTSSSSSSKSRQLSVMLIIDSASIISCTLPLTICMMLDQFFPGSGSLRQHPTQSGQTGASVRYRILPDPGQPLRQLFPLLSQWSPFPRGPHRSTAILEDWTERETHLQHPGTVPQRSFVQPCNQIKQEVHELRMKSVLRNGDDLSKICARCKAPFGLLFNTGDLCPVCHFRVCKECRESRLDSQGWLCTLCFKENQLRWMTGQTLTGKKKEGGDTDTPTPHPLSPPPSLRDQPSSRSTSPSNMLYAGE